MATYNDRKSWQKFLAPLVAALVALCGAGAAYLKSSSETKTTEDRLVERVVKIETKLESQDYRLTKNERDAEILKATLSDIKGDVSFIRGKLEGKK